MLNRLARILALTASLALLTTPLSAQEVVTGGPSTANPLGTQPIANSAAVNPATNSVFTTLPQGVFNTTPPTPANGGVVPFQVNSSGQLITALPSGAATAANQNATAAGTSATSAQAVQGVTNGVPVLVDLYLIRNAPGSTQGFAANIQGTPNGTPVTAAEAGSSAAAVGITPTVTQSGTSLVGKATAGNLYSAYATNFSGNPGYLITVNAASAPAAGAALTPQDIVPLPANGQASLNYSAGPPDTFTTGVVVLLSTSATTYTTTSGPSGFIKARVR